MILLTLLTLIPIQGPSRTITSVDLYGLRSQSPEAVREAAGIAVGEALSETVDAIESRLRALPGVEDAQVSPVFYPQNFALFIGIRETGSALPRFREAPSEDLRLPASIVEAVEFRGELLREAVNAGQAGEDGSEGHAFSEYEPMRAIESDYVGFANVHFDVLQEVLQRSRHREERIAAAEVIGYADDKAAVAPVLQFAATDADSHVRNNAVRALGVLADFAQERPELGIRVDPAPFLALIGSLQWTDRNKGAAVLDQLTEARDPALLARLRSEGLAQVTEMAHWQSRGHATFSIRILARMAGLEESELEDGLGTTTAAEEREAWIEELHAKARALSEQEAASDTEEAEK